MPLHEVDIWNGALRALGHKQIRLEPVAAASREVFTAITAANPAVVTDTSHPFSTGDRILIRGADDTPDVNHRVFEVIKVNADSYQLFEENRVGKGTTVTAGAYATLLDDSEAIRQCHKAFREKRDEVIREHPWNRMVKRGRLSRLAGAVTVSAATAANPVVCTAASHGYTTGDLVLFEDFDEMVELNGRYLMITKVDDNSFSIDNEDGSDYTAESTGGTAKKALTPLKPDSDYTAHYSLPTDCLRLLEFVDEPFEEWTVEGEEVLCAIGPTVPVRYIRNDVLDPDEWDPNLVAALEARLAYELVGKLTTQTGRTKQDYWSDYRGAVLAAQKADGMEDSAKPYPEDRWILARL